MIKLCPPGEHVYVKRETCIGTIFFCTRCIDWTKKVPVKPARPESFVEGRKLTRQGTKKP